MNRYTQSFQAIGVSLLYVFVGLGLIILNRFILKSLNFPYPIFLSGLGVFLSGILAHVSVWVGVVQIQRAEAVEGSLWYSRVLPVGFFQACTLSFGNMVYLMLDVGFIQMLKSFTPVVILLCGYIAAIDQPAMPVIYAVLIISVGTAATCSFSPSFNPLGLCIMFLSILSESIRLVLTQFMLQQLKFGVVEGLYVLAPASAFWLMVASLIFEYSSMVKTGAFFTLFSQLHYFILASLMGVIINFISYLVIQTTSSLTMKILGTLRNIITILIGVALYGEMIPLKEAAGYTVALVGFTMYNMAKMGQLDNVAFMNTAPNAVVRYVVSRCCRFLMFSSAKRSSSRSTLSSSSDTEQSQLLSTLYLGKTHAMAAEYSETRDSQVSHISFAESENIDGSENKGTQSNV